MAHIFRNKLGYDLQIGHAYLIRLTSTVPVKESANVVMFYLGMSESGHPSFTPILDDNPMENEATIDAEIFDHPTSKGVVAVIGRFELVDCNPDEITKGKKQSVAPEIGEGKHRKH